MSLTYTGKRAANTAGGGNAQASDPGGQPVTVHASDEALQDYGWGVIESVGSGKYDAGDWTQVGPVRAVEVSTDDCKAAGY